MTQSHIDPIRLTQELIRCPSITPIEGGALDVLEKALTTLGFDVSRVTLEESDSEPVENLYARLGKSAPNFCFAGHTDVVPPGPESEWTTPPFDAAIKDGMLTGRGAADMKGAIAAFIAAAQSYLTSNDTAKSNGSISLLITGDEEGPAINGTRKMLDWLKEHGEIIDHCLVGEPTNPDRMGQMIKVGRRGSINCWVNISGKQGHVAYPHRAENPLHAVPDYINALTHTPLDDGYDHFQASSLQITEIESDNPAHNVIPGDVKIRFNIRFNPNWTGKTIQTWIGEKLKIAETKSGFSHQLKAIVSGEAFLTRDEAYLTLLKQVVERHTNGPAEFSTSGGTSDARFIQRDAPVAEFGLVGATMHQVDERVATSDITLLTKIYTDILHSYYQHYGETS